MRRTSVRGRSFGVGSPGVKTAAMMRSASSAWRSMVSGRARDDRDLRAGLAPHARGLGGRGARAQHQDLRGLAPEMARRDLEGNAPCDDAHGREERRAPAAIADELPRDGAGTPRGQSPRTLRHADEMLEREDRGALGHRRDLGGLDFLHLHDELRVPRVAGHDHVRARAAIVVIGEARALAGLRFHLHVVAGGHELFHRQGRERHAALAFLGLARDADDHRSARRASAMSCGPR